MAICKVDDLVEAEEEMTEVEGAGVTDIEMVTETTLALSVHCGQKWRACFLNPYGGDYY